MSFFFDIAKFSKILAVRCKNFTDDLVSQFFLAYDFWPIILGAVGIGVFLARKEIFYVILTTGFTIDAAVNWGLRTAFSQEGPEATCFSGDEMPAYAADGIAFLGITFLVGSACIYRVPMHKFTIAMIMIGGPVALYARVWLRANTPAQMFAGAGFGTLWACLFLLLLDYVFTYDFIRRWFLTYDSFFTGSDFQDTLMRPSQPVICGNAPPSRIFYKLSTSCGMQSARTLEQFGLANQVRQYVRREASRANAPDVSTTSTDPVFDEFHSVGVTNVRMYYLSVS